jgi:hypothetical protein
MELVGYGDGHWMAYLQLSHHDAMGSDGNVR